MSEIVCSERKNSRIRIAAWLRYYREKYSHQYPTHESFARALGVSQTTVVNILNGRRTPGLDILVELHHRFHVSADTIINTDPPEAGGKDHVA
jgi:transcriptional regulator with XRE-family HTH domain